VLVISFIGTLIGQYTSIVDALWDLKTVFLTAIFITGFYEGFINEYKWHSRLKEQYYVYIEFIYKSECFVNGLYALAGINSRIDLKEYCSNENSSRGLENYLARQKKKVSHREEVSFIQDTLSYKEEMIPRRLFCIDLLDHYLNDLKELSSFINSELYIGDRHLGSEWLSDLYSVLNRELLSINYMNLSLSNEIFLNFLLGVLSPIAIVIISLRKPWYWDKEINDKIEGIINRNQFGKC
jgi:hypothetical protein